MLCGCMVVAEQSAMQVQHPRLLLCTFLLYDCFCYCVSHDSATHMASQVRYIWKSCTVVSSDPKLLVCPPLGCRYLMEFTSDALAEYPGLGIEVWSLPGQAWITVRLNTCCVRPFSCTPPLQTQAKKCVHGTRTRSH